MKRKEDIENDNGDSQMSFPILCIFLYLNYERVLSVYSIKLVTKRLKICRISRKLVYVINLFVMFWWLIRLTFKPRGRKNLSFGISLFVRKTIIGVSDQV